MNFRSLEEIANNEALRYAIYTVENRAIPSMVDGLKPVQRFFLHRVLTAAKGNKDKFIKVASLAGGVSELGYHHGEGSAEKAGVLLANDWNNNIPIIEGDGNFGSRIVQEAAAGRYVFARAHKNYWDIYKDSNLAPTHDDPEHIPPRFYLPIIPMVLANGVSGIATGYATDILPHSRESLVECTKLAIKGQLNKEPVVQFPEFRGKQIVADDKIILEGTYEFSSKTKLMITELPIKYDREKYVTILDKMEDDNKISSYKDLCGKNGFKFEITLKRDNLFFGEAGQERHELIMREFKLRQTVSQNITVIGECGKLKEYSRASDLIKDFVKIRAKYVEQRIDVEKEKAREAANYARVKIEFIDKVLSEAIVLKGKKRKDAVDEIKSHESMTSYAEALISLSMYSITSDEIEKLKREADKLDREVKYWEKTTPTKEFLKDLEQI